MNIFTNKNIWKKIVIAFLIVLSFQVLIVKPVQADVVEFGGKLIGPIMSLLVTIGDGIMDVIGRTIMGANSTLVEVNMESEIWDKLAPILVGIVAGALFIVGCVVTLGGLAAVASAALGITVTATVGVGVLIGGAATGILVGTWFDHEVMPDDLYLPIYTYSAEEIFKGNILLFDVNFFHEGKEIYAKVSDGTELNLSDYSDESAFQEEVRKHGTALTGTTTKAEDAAGGKKEGEVKYYFWKDYNHKDKDGNPTEVRTSNQNSAVMLRKTIASWYNAIRNICLVLMLSVLVYIGIRMLLSSVASDKAKYSTMLKDWFVGLCLLFLMHYIMAFSVTIVEKITDVVKTSVGANGYVVVLEDEEGEDGPLCKKVKELGQEDTIATSNGKTFVSWPTNLMGDLRTRLQMEDYGAQYVGLSICFIILCLFTLYFTIIYLKRFLHLAFLTIIAPMVALTYCIDKLNDGQAQGFNKWMKEYIFNLLIQPMHLLLYYILVTSAFELAGKNVIYSIVAIGFMIPAEKLLRSLFGFEKASTAPAMGTAGAMMASTALNHLLNRGKKGQGNNGGSNGGSSEEGSGRVPNALDSGNPMDNLVDGAEEGTSIHAEELPDPVTEPELSTDSGIILPDSVRMDREQEVARQARLERERLEQEERERIDEELEEENSPSRMQRMKERARNRLGSTPGGRRALRNLDASWAAQKAAIRMAPQHFKEKIENSHPMKRAGKMAAGVATGIAAGALGTAIAASTGEDGNLAKIGGGLAATGYAVGSGRAANTRSPMDDSTVKAVYDNTRNKGEYKEEAMKDYVEKYTTDEKNRNYLERKFDAATAKEMLEGGEIEEYLRNDITDIKEMAAMHKLQTEGVVKDRKQAISVAQLDKMVGTDTNNMTTKKRDEWKNRFGDMSGVSNEKTKEVVADRTIAQLDQYNKFKK